MRDGTIDRHSKQAKPSALQTKLGCVWHKLCVALQTQLSAMLGIIQCSRKGPTLNRRRRAKFND